MPHGQVAVGNSIDQIISNGERLLSRAEAAEYLGLSAHTLAIWASTKRVRLPFVKIGSLAKYRRSDIEEFIKSRTIAA